MKKKYQKCLSICQPFASLIAQGDKKLENRSWQTQYRGDLIICATATKVHIDQETLPFKVAICLVSLTKITTTKAGYAWHLENPRPIVPVPITGHPRIFSPGKPIKIEYLPQDCDHIALFNLLFAS